MKSERPCVMRCASDLAAVGRAVRRRTASKGATASVVQKVAADPVARMLIADRKADVAQVGPMASVVLQAAGPKGVGLVVVPMASAVLQDVARQRAARMVAADRWDRWAVRRIADWKRYSFGSTAMATTC